MKIDGWVVWDTKNDKMLDEYDVCIDYFTDKTMKAIPLFHSRDLCLQYTDEVLCDGRFEPRKATLTVEEDES